MKSQRVVHPIKVKIWITVRISRIFRILSCHKSRRNKIIKIYRILLDLAHRLISLMLKIKNYNRANNLDNQTLKVIASKFLHRRLWLSRSQLHQMIPRILKSCQKLDRLATSWVQLNKFQKWQTICLSLISEIRPLPHKPWSLLNVLKCLSVSENWHLCFKYSTSGGVLPKWGSINLTGHRRRHMPSFSKESLSPQRGPKTHQSLSSTVHLHLLSKSQAYWWTNTKGPKSQQMTSIIPTQRKVHNSHSQEIKSILLLVSTITPRSAVETSMPVSYWGRLWPNRAWKWSYKDWGMRSHYGIENIYIRSSDN